jgi:hypothetical protein
MVSSPIVGVFVLQIVAGWRENAIMFFEFPVVKKPSRSRPILLGSGPPAVQNKGSGFGILITLVRPGPGGRNK